MAGQAKIVIDGDASKAVGAANKLGTAMQDAAKKAGGIDSAIGKANENLGKSIVRVGSLVTVLKAAAAAMEAFNERASKTAQGNRDLGKQTLDRAKAYQAIGVTDQQGAETTVRNLAGGTSLEERTASVTAFADYAKSARVKPTQGQFYEFQRLASTGVYSNDELIERMKRGLPLPTAAETQSKIEALPQEAQDELRTRDLERANKVREMEALSSAGRANRVAESDIATRKAENPLAFGVQDTVKGTIGFIPGVNETVDAGQREMIKLQRDIAESNKDMANRAGLQVNLPTRPDEAR